MKIIVGGLAFPASRISRNEWLAMLPILPYSFHYVIWQTGFYLPKEDDFRISNAFLMTGS